MTPGDNDIEMLRACFQVFLMAVGVGFGLGLAFELGCWIRGRRR